MRRRSKVSARLQSIIDPRLEKPLLHMHAANDVDSFWAAVQDVIGAAIPTCFIGLTLQHGPISPRIAKATQKLPGSFSRVCRLRNISTLIRTGKLYSLAISFPMSATSGGPRFTAVVWLR
jgi:hypothetical protein